MTVKELKDLLSSILNNLDDFDDNDEIRKESNTYFLGNTEYFLGISGYNGGYIDLANINIDEDEEEDY